MSGYSLEAVGVALYGDVWVAQLSRELKNKQGRPLPQSTLKSMRDRGNTPDYIKDQIRVVVEQRLAVLSEISKEI